MNNYRIDFTMGRDHEMLIDREVGFDRNELEEIELNMLGSTSIPYLLPVDWFEVDGKLTFRYRLTGYKMLVHRLQRQPLSMDQYYSLVLGLTDALFECKDYMLRPAGCLLHDQFIFIGEQLQDIRLAYIPVKEKDGKASMEGGELLSIIIRWTSYVEQIDGQGLRRILQHFNGKRWPLPELRDTLLDLIGGHLPADQNPKQATLYEEKVIGENVAEGKWLDGGVNHDELSSNGHLFNEELPEDNVPPVAMDDEIPYAEEPEAETDHRKRWIAPAALLVICAAVWRFVYLADPSRQSLLICAGVTLLLIAAAGWIWGKRPNSAIKQDKTPEASGGFSSMSGPFKRRSANWTMNIPPLQPEFATGPGGPSSLFDGSFDTVVEAKPVPPAAMPTLLLASDKENQAERTDAQFFTWLKRVWQGQEEKIALAASGFKIGRTGEQVNYADHAPGVSRIHLEIEHISGKHYAKDLGSRNGSLLNGEPMIPYKSYSIAAGDQIRLAGKDGPLYELESGPG